MRKLLFSFLACAIVCISASPAWAEYNWISAGQFGTKPDRVEVLVDIGNAKAEEAGPFGAREAFIGLPVYIIYESASNPDYSRFTLRNYCDGKRPVKIADVFTYYRNDTKSEAESSIVFESTPQFIQSLMGLVCGNSAAVLSSGQFKQIPAENAKDPYPNSYPWKKVWLDGKRPPYTSADKRTRAEKDVEFNALMAQAKGQLAGAEASAVGKIAQSNAEDAFWKDQAVRRKNRPKSKLNAPLEGWLRKNETFIVQQMGIPDKAYLSGNTRMLYYDSRGNWSQVFTTTDQYGRVLNTARKDYFCEVTLELQNDQLIDFKVNGNSCDYGEFRR